MGARREDERKDGEEGAASTPAGAPALWSRRRVMGWALGLVPVAAAGGWMAFDAWRERQTRAEKAARAVQLTQHAAELCFAGLAEARSRLTEALHLDSTHAPAWLLWACLHLREGSTRQVREALDSVHLRETPEGRLLGELLERQARAPDLQRAFLESWRAVGSPDFRESVLLPAPLAPMQLLINPSFAFSSAGDAERLPLAILDLDASTGQWLLEHVPTTQSLPLLLALWERLANAGATGAWVPSLLASVEARLERLAGPSPGSLQLALRPFLAAGTPTTPFTRGDLERLEALVALPAWKQDTNEHVFQETRELLRALPGPGHHAWMVMAWAQTGSLAVALTRRARASQAHLTEDERRWLGRLLYTAGERLRAERSLQELDLGLRLQMFGAELTGHGETRMACIAAFGALDEGERAAARAGVDRWPLVTLREAFRESRARDEGAWLNAFAGKGEPP